MMARDDILEFARNSELFYRVKVSYCLYIIKETTYATDQ